jgi:hypothetical protein
MVFLAIYGQKHPWNETLNTHFLALFGYQQNPLQSVFLDRYLQARGLSALDVVGHGGPAQAQALSNLALTESSAPFES